MFFATIALAMASDYKNMAGGFFISFAALLVAYVLPIAAIFLAFLVGHFIYEKNRNGLISGVAGVFVALLVYWGVPQVVLMFPGGTNVLRIVNEINIEREW